MAAAGNGVLEGDRKQKMLVFLRNESHQCPRQQVPSDAQAGAEPPRASIQAPVLSTHYFISIPSLASKSSPQSPPSPNRSQRKHTQRGGSPSPHIIMALLPLL